MKPSLLLFACLLFLPGCYLIEQSKGQYRLSFHQVPLREAIQNEKNPTIKKGLEHVHQIRKFAVDHLLLKDAGQYSGYYHTEQEGITYVVTAAFQTELKPYTWWFPFLGDLPYKGYFSKKDAIESEQLLIEEGYDTWRFTAPAYSTLGYFSDPVTTPMLRRGLFFLTKIILHELVHGTVFISGNTDFNEQLAKFVELEGALQYLKSQSLLTPEYLREIERYRKKQIAFQQIIHHYIGKAKTLYQKEKEPKRVLKERETLFQNLTDDILELYPEDQRDQWKFNNARLLQYQRYQEASPVFQKIWDDSQQNWQVFWEKVRRYAKEIEASLE